MNYYFSKVFEVFAIMLLWILIIPVPPLLLSLDSLKIINFAFIMYFKCSYYKAMTLARDFQFQNDNPVLDPQEAVADSPRQQL